MKGVYKITNTANDKFYIGSSKYLSARKGKHFASLAQGNHGNSKLQAAYNKYGHDQFVFEVIEEVEKEEQLIVREQFYIDTLKPEYNIRLQAENNYGIHRTPEQKKRLSEFWTGKKKGIRSEQHKRRLGEALKGKNKGRVKPIGFKEHLSSIRKGNLNPAFGRPSAKRKRILQLDSITNEVVGEHLSVVGAVVSLGYKPHYGSISDCLKGRREVALGFKWRYKT